MAFIGGQLDLREAYLHPEVENAVYLVEAQKGTLMYDIITAAGHNRKHVA